MRIKKEVNSQCFVLFCQSFLYHSWLLNVFELRQLYVPFLLTWLQEDQCIFNTKQRFFCDTKQTLVKHKFCPYAIELHNTQIKTGFYLHEKKMRSLSWCNGEHMCVCVCVCVNICFLSHGLCCPLCPGLPRFKLP